MSAVVGLSVPEVVDGMRPLWDDWSLKERERLAWQWTDHSIRKALALLFERCEHHQEASLLRSLPEMRDPGTLARAAAVLDTLARQLDDFDVLPAIFSALVGLDEMKVKVDLANAAFSTLMTSRFVFEDDRLLTMMTQDLVPRHD